MATFIHNNFRKLLRRIVAVGYSSGTSDIDIKDFTDITGYTGGENDNPATITYNNVFTRSATGKTLSSIRNDSSTSVCGLIYGAIGRSIENEPDYDLGETIDTILVSSSPTRGYNTTFVSTIVNSSNTSIEFDEIALFIHYKTSSGTPWNGGTNMNFMLMKKNLDAPITLPAGASVTVTCSLFSDVEPDIEVEVN